MAAKRHQKAINVYGESEIETVKRAIRHARASSGVETESDVAVEMAEVYLQARAAGFSNPRSEAATRTLTHAIRAAIESGDAEDVDDAVVEIAGAYTGWSAPR